MFLETYYQTYLQIKDAIDLKTANLFLQSVIEYWLYHKLPEGESNPYVDLVMIQIKKMLDKWWDSTLKSKSNNVDKKQYTSSSEHKVFHV